MPVTPTTTVNVRYMVADVEAAVAWIVLPRVAATLAGTAICGARAAAGRATILACCVSPVCALRHRS